jgi:hypothetical protein
LGARGIIYPERWGSQHGHFGLMAALSSGNDTELAAGFADKEAARIVLLSSEVLSYASETDIQRLRAHLSGHPVTVVFYARRWSERIPSYWREQVTHG